jgi:hypothetical protein
VTERSTMKLLATYMGLSYDTGEGVRYAFTALHLHPGLATASTASWALWSSARHCSAPNILSNFRSRSALASYAILMTTALNPDPDSDFLRIRSTCQPLPRRLVLLDAATPINSNHLSFSSYLVLVTVAMRGLVRSRGGGLASDLQGW